MQAIVKAVVEELGDDVLARLNPSTGEIENLEVWFLSTRLLRQDLLKLAVVADLRLPAWRDAAAQKIKPAHE